MNFSLRVVKDAHDESNFEILKSATSQEQQG